MSTSKTRTPMTRNDIPGSRIEVTPQGLCKFERIYAPNGSIDFKGIIDMKAVPSNEYSKSHLHINRGPGQCNGIMYMELSVARRVTAEFQKFRATQSVNVSDKESNDKKTVESKDKKSNDKRQRRPTTDDTKSDSVESNKRSVESNKKSIESNKKSAESNKRQRPTTDETKTESESIGQVLLYEGVLKKLVCPLTGLPFVDPVVAADGKTYSRSAFEQYITGWYLQQYHTAHLQSQIVHVVKRNVQNALNGFTGPIENVKSPVTGETLANHRVTPNHTIRDILALLL